MSNVENSMGLFDTQDFKNTGMGQDCMFKAENSETQESAELDVCFTGIGKTHEP